MPIIALNQPTIKSLTVQPGKARTEWCDSQLPGLYAEARSSAPGKVTFYLRYKDSGGTTRHWRLGCSTEMSVAAARAAAKQKQAEIQLGAEPHLERQAQKAVPTLRAFIDEQYMPYIKARKRSWKGDVNRLNQRLLPKFGDYRLSDITRKQLVEFHLALKEEGLAGATCDHFIKLMRAMFNVAIEWGVVETNPAAKIKLFNEWNQVENYLSDDELGRLLVILDTHEQRLACKVAKFLLSTGARLNEALSAIWEDIDRDTGVWKIPAINSKSKKVRALPLNDSAKAVLDTLLPAVPTGPVFVNPRSKEQLKTVHKAWGKIRVAAGLPHLRIHDLRHLHASFLVNAGRTLYEVQLLLGHSSPLVTQRYAHLDQRTLQDASNSASQHLQAVAPKLLPAL